MSNLRKTKIKVFAVDDLPVVVEGVRSCLRSFPQIEVVGVASSTEEALTRCRKLAPDVILMGVVGSGVDGLEVVRQLRQSSPKAKVLMFAGREDTESVGEMIQVGAKGCIRKSASPGELAAAIEKVHQGESFFSADVAQTFFEEYVKRGGRAQENIAKRISERERQVLHLIVEGAANKEAADTLRISVRTVEKHRQRIMKKLGVHKATELVRFAITKGIVNVGAY